MDMFGGVQSPYLTQPVVAKETHTGMGTGAFAGVKFALSSMQGWRVSMEDAHSHILPVPEQPKLGFFGVFDGHGGDLAAKFAAKHVLTYIQNSEAFEGISHDEPDADIIARAMMEGFIDCDEDLKEFPLVASGEDFSGSTGVAVFLTPTHIIVANTGDSRVCVCKSDKVVFASYDHKPNDDKEKDRVEKAGGIVSDGRVNGDLASARSFGDFRYKKDKDLPPSKQQITVLPDVTILPRSKDDQFILLACDGIWDVMSNLEGTRYMLTAMKKGVGIAKACEMLLDECLRKSSGDNMSVMCIGLEALPKEEGSLRGPLPTSDEIREGMVDSII